MAARKNPRARTKPDQEMDLEDLVFIAEKLEAVVCALDSASGGLWSPFTTFPDDRSEPEVSESLQLVLFDQAIALSCELRQGLNRLAERPEQAA